MLQVDQRVFDGAEHAFGPYDVRKHVSAHRRPVMVLRKRNLPPSGSSTFHVTTPSGLTATCVLAAADPWPVELRRGIVATVGDTAVTIAKRWFRSAVIAGPNFSWSLRRRGPFGFAIRDEASGGLLASLRYGVLTVAGDLSPRDAALVVALVEADVVSCVSPFAWLRGL